MNKNSLAIQRATRYLTRYLDYEDLRERITSEVALKINASNTELGPKVIEEIKRAVLEVLKEGLELTHRELESRARHKQSIPEFLEHLYGTRVRLAEVAVNSYLREYYTNFLNKVPPYTIWPESVSVKGSFVDKK